MSKHCILTFATSGGGTKTVTIANPIDSMAPSIVGSAATDIITSNVFETASGSLSMLKKAEIRTVTRTEVI